MSERISHHDKECHYTITGLDHPGQMCHGFNHGDADGKPIERRVARAEQRSDVPQDCKFNRREFKSKFEHGPDCVDERQRQRRGASRKYAEHSASCTYWTTNVCNCAAGSSVESAAKEAAKDCIVVLLREFPGANTASNLEAFTDIIAKHYAASSPVSKLVEALQRIADSGGCGCSPCHCRHSVETLTIELHEIKGFAQDALADYSHSLARDAKGSNDADV